MRRFSDVIKENQTNSAGVARPSGEFMSPEAMQKYWSMADSAYSYLKDRHPEIHRLITQDSAVPVDPVQTIQAIQHMGANRALAFIKDGLNKETKKMYDPNEQHPWGRFVGQYPVRESRKLSIRSSVQGVLLEGLNMDVTWKKHGEKISHRMFDEGIFDEHKEALLDHLQRGDPTEHKEYAPWLASRYANGGINRLEDMPARAHHALGLFHDAKIRKKLGAHGLSADINSYKNLEQLEDAVDKLPKKETEGPSAKEIKAEGAVKFDEPHWTVVTPMTHAAACLYGSGTRWCTTQRDPGMFNMYNKQGPMHILIPKEPAYQGEKYQIHLPSGQFMNEKDSPANLGKVLEGRPSPTFNKYLKHGDVVKLKDPGSRAALASDPDLAHHFMTDSNPNVMNAVIRARPDLKPQVLDIARMRGQATDMMFVHGHSENQVEREAAAEEATKLAMQPKRIGYGNVDRHDPELVGVVKSIGSPEQVERVRQATLHTALTGKHLDQIKDAMQIAGEHEKPQLVDAALASTGLEEQKFGLQHASKERKDKWMESAENIHDEIKQELIKQGDYHDKFMHDPSTTVRGMVARYGSETHRKWLRENDPVPYIRNVATHFQGHESTTR